MNFENEFFRLLESSKAKKIIQDMLGEKMYSEKEAIQRGDMHINEKNIIRKRIKNIAPQNERKVRKLEEELKQYEIQYKKGKALLEQLEKDLKEKDNKVNQLEKDIETKESKINHLEQELTDKCSEYDNLQKNNPFLVK